MKISLLGFGAMILLLAGCDRDPNPTVTVTDYGIYNATVTTGGNWTDKVPVTIQSVKDLKLKETTTRIPCRDKINFGWRCHITNDWDQPIMVTYAMSHPLITNPDGNSTGEEEATTMFVQPHATGDLQSIWFFLDSCPHEYVPGTWTFHMEINGKPAARQQFEVYRPDPGFKK